MIMRRCLIFWLALSVGCGSLEKKSVSDTAAEEERAKDAPVWVVGALSDSSVDAVSELSLKRKKMRDLSRTVKPQGPLRVNYLLENWGADDYRLIVEVEARTVIDDWQVQVVLHEDQTRKLKLSELSILKPTVNVRGFQDRRYFKLGSVGGGSRLFVTVTGWLAGRAVSKTVAVRLTASDVEPKVCVETERDCVRLLPAKTIY